MTHFEKYAEVYDFFNEHKDYDLEAKYAIDCLEELSIKGKNIIELGSGTGRHSCFFLKSGYSLNCVEPSKTMLKKAEENKVVAEALANKNCELIESTIEKFKLKKPANGAVALFHVISYLTTFQEALKSFLNLNQMLETGAPFLFDVWYTPGVLSDPPSTRVRHYKKNGEDVLRIAESTDLVSTSRVDVNYTFIANGKQGSQSTFSEVHSMRHYTLSELQLLLEMSGFKFVFAREWLTKNSIENKKLWYAVIGAKKA